MKELIGKTVKLSIKANGSTLFYTAKIIEVTKTHVAFIDKFKKYYLFKKENIEEIST